MKVLMSAAHGGWNSEIEPLGGGAAICERLCGVWPQSADLSMQLLGSGPSASTTVEYERIPTLTGCHPAKLNEFEYARFCHTFEEQTTQRALELRPDVLLTHDISEGPNFAKLANAGIRCIPIFHVDVVDYFNRYYLGDLLPPSWLTSLHRSSRTWLPWPKLLKLVFEKQRQAIEHCPYVVVPSAPMKSIMQNCYPGISPQRFQVVPWGAPLQRHSQPEIDAARAQLCQSWNLSEDAPVLMTLSRISPEKNQVALLESLKYGELYGRTPLGLTLVIAGDPAYMRGQSYLETLKKKASQLRKTRVIFAGHLGGARKVALLRRAQLMIVPSSHESYGLTTLEAMSNGLPVIGFDSYGIQATVTPQTGMMVSSRGNAHKALWEAIQKLLDDPVQRERLGKGALEYANANSFQRAADQLMSLMQRFSKTTSPPSLVS
jgi:glycosyltransferase involved in cell wall biosynthesis